MLWMSNLSAPIQSIIRITIFFSYLEEDLRKKKDKLCLLLVRGNDNETIKTAKLVRHVFTVPSKKRKKEPNKQETSIQCLVLYCFFPDAI